MVPRSNVILFRVLPTVAILVVAGFAFFGSYGVREERQLARKAEDAREAWLAIDRGNDKLVFELRRLGADPVVVERAVADELGLARPGAKLYRFDDEELAAPAAEPAVDADGAP